MWFPIGQCRPLLPSLCLEQRNGLTLLFFRTRTNALRTKLDDPSPFLCLFTHTDFRLPHFSESEPAGHSSGKASPLPRPATSTAGRAERTRSSHAPALEGEPTAATSGTTHHVEQHLRTDVHTSAPLHREATAPLCKHLAGVDEVFATVISFTFFRVTQGLVRFSDVFEPLSCTLIVRIFIRVMHNRQLPICLLDLIVIGVLLHTKDLVVVLAFRFLELKLCVADFLCNTRLLGVRFGNGFVFIDGSLPVPGFAKGAGFGFAGFGV